MTNNDPEVGGIGRERPRSQAPGRRSSSQWRCLWRLRFGAYALIVLLVLESLSDFICESLPPLESGECATMGPWLYWLAASVILLSIFACVSQWWHDFTKRERYANQLGGHRRRSRPSQ